MIITTFFISLSVFLFSDDPLKNLPIVAIAAFLEGMAGIACGCAGRNFVPKKYFQTYVVCFLFFVVSLVILSCKVSISDDFAFFTGLILNLAILLFSGGCGFILLQIANINSLCQKYPTAKTDADEDD